MDIESSVINEIKNFFPYMEEEFLINISNKGIYNRAKKDLEKIKDNICVSLTDSLFIQVSASNDFTVTLDKNVQQSICTCPSQSICKHIIMSVLYLKQYYQDNKTEDNDNDINENICKIEESNFDYIDLKELTDEKAIKIIGKKDYNSLVSSINIKNEAVFEYNEMLEVSIKSKNVKVYFPKNNSIENSICSCKEKDLCIHKSYAIIAYMIKELNINLSNKESKINIGEQERNFLIRLNSYIALLMDTGLSSLTYNEIKKIEKLYIQSYGMKFFNIAEELKSLSSELSFYFSKNVSFSNRKIMNTFCKIYNTALAINLNINDDKLENILLGKRVDESFNLDNINLIGLGCTCFLTKRKDFVLSAYFYCTELNSILSISTLRHLDENYSLDYLYSSGMIWENELSFETASVSKVFLKGAKISIGKISSTRQTKCSIKGKTKVSDLKNIIFEDYNILKQELNKKAFQYFEKYNQTSNIYLIKVNKLNNIHFDKINQKLKFDVFDKSENIIEFEIKYNTVTEYGIKAIESKNENKVIFDYILGSIKEKNDSLYGTLLSGILDDEIKNIFFK